MTSPDLPFTPVGGSDKQAAIHNRISVIKRIEFLSGVNLQSKSKEYLKALDLELYKRWYHNEPRTKRADEEFCQRSAEVIQDIEKNGFDLDQREFDDALSHHKNKPEDGHVDQQSEGDSKNAGEADQPVED
ncbi:MAG: hypothetical protein NUV91_09285 [Candidatus Omnitrophica bacterium]|nr:hypothetical protein [Candidatus Omnitrophota bacterium]